MTAKGFNRFIWDYESKPGKENIYGMFASHGALLVANSEAALKVHDIENGWDWAKVPGTTTIAIGETNLDYLNIGKARFYNKKGLAGGLTFKGTGALGNGIFGMDFEQPDYGLTGWRNNIKFEFKKSIFFFENLLVCPGKSIKAQDTNGKVVQTTLFQDKLTSSFPHIKVNGVEKTSLSVTTPSTGSYTTLTDAKGNFYYIPSNSKSILKVHAQNQNSKIDSGTTVTSGLYGTAWFQHGTSPTDDQFEYAVLIPTDTYQLTSSALTAAQETTDSKVYKVLQKDRYAHVVQFLKSPESGSDLSHAVTGYVMFAKNRPLPPEGPVEEVNRKDCLIMAEETTEFIFLSISIPSLNLATPKGSITNSDDMEQEELYHSSSAERDVEVTLRKKVQESVVSVHVHGKPDCYKPNVWVLTGFKIVQFANLKNGFSVEVKLKKRPQELQ